MKLLENYEKIDAVTATDTGASSVAEDENNDEKSTDNQSSGQGPGGSGEASENQSRFSRDDPSIAINQGQRPLALDQQSSLNNNNLFIDVEFEGTEDDTMGDLQSPQYVKRTAHMFDSRFSSAEHGANGHDRNGRNPSYLNVSRSVSGYSCLAYNNGSVTSETVTNKSVLGNNGATLLSTTSRVSSTGPRLKTDFSLHSPFSRSNKVPNTDDDSSDHSSNQSATSPPPSLPPINTTSSRFSDSTSYFQNGMSRVVGPEDLIEDTPYIPSHGKSFIMQRIERLYGSDAVQNKQVLSRKSSNSSTSPHVTTISISRESPPRRMEHIIPIKVEPRDDHENNLYNNIQLEHGKMGEEHVIPISLSDGGKVTSMRSSAGGNEGNNVRRIPIETRRSSSSRPPLDDSDEDLEELVKTRRARSKSPTKNLNGNANRYRNGVNTASSPTSCNGKHTTGKRSIVSEERSSTDANGCLGENANDRKIIGLEQDCTIVMKKTLSRESSAESDNSIELASIGSDDNSKSLGRKDSQDNSLYSNRGSTSPVKPKPKPKPKDMALLRTLSRSPASLKTGQEVNDKTASISLNFVQSESENENQRRSTEDQVDRAQDNNSVTMLVDIKNTISPIAGDKVVSPTPTPPPTIEQESHTNRDKENKPECNTEHVQPKPTQAQSPVVKDGNYFKNEMSKVTKDILRFSENAAKELDSLDPSEDRAGSIHAAIGKGNLLVKKKFKQFEGLCDSNLKGATADEPETTNEDLAGFWDMVMIQVEQIYSLFEDLEKNEQFELIPKTPTKSSSPKRAPTTSKPTPKVGATPKVNSAAAKARDEARRKMLAEKRRMMKSQMQQEQQEAVTEPEAEAEVQIFTPDSAPPPAHTG